MEKKQAADAHSSHPRPPTTSFGRSSLTPPPPAGGFPDSLLPARRIVASLLRMPLQGTSRPLRGLQRGFAPRGTDVGTVVQTSTIVFAIVLTRNLVKYIGKTIVKYLNNILPTSLSFFELLRAAVYRRFAPPDALRARAFGPEQPPDLRSTRGPEEL